MAPIRVALCITDLDVGGAERCLQNLAIGLNRERFDPIVYCLGPRPQTPEASCADPIEAAGIPVHCLGANRAWHFPRTVRQLRRLLADQAPQILQSFLFHGNFVGRLAARRAGIAHVLSGIRVAEHHSKWHLWLDRWTQHLVERHVCVSKSVAEFSAHQGGLAEERLVVIPNGIDCNAVSAIKPADLAKLDIETGRRAITFIGRLQPQKGLTWLLDSAVQWLPRVPDHDLLLVGSGEQHGDLERQAQQLQIANRVHFAGWRPDVLEILAASDLLVLPSRWEGMPNVVLQAMAVAKPVLATSVEGACELLGELAEPQTATYGETEVFSDKLVAIVSNPSESTRLGARNRHRAEQEFALTRMVRSYEQLWESLARS